MKENKAQFGDLIQIEEQSGRGLSGSEKQRGFFVA